MNKIKKILSVALSLLLIISLSACGTQAENDSNKLKITATTTFLGDAAEIIGGEHVEVTRLMGAGIDPHQYQASSSDLTKLQNADIIFYAGLHLEAKLGEVLEKIEGIDVEVVNTSRNIPKNQLLYSEDLSEDEIAQTDEEEGLYDPHIWFDINLWRIVVADVTDTLIAQDSENAADYKAAFEKYNKELDALETYAINRIQEIPESSRYLVTAHDAFNYFSRYVGMDVRGIQGVSTNVEAGTNDVMDVANFIVDHEVKAIFIESSVSPKLVQALQESVKTKGFSTEIGGELFSDSTGDEGTEEGTYIGMYKHNIDTIVEALK